MHEVHVRITTPDGDARVLPPLRIQTSQPSETIEVIVHDHQVAMTRQGALSFEVRNGQGIWRDAGRLSMIFEQAVHEKAGTPAETATERPAGLLN